jgi:hypothetical protein
MPETGFLSTALKNPAAYALQRRGGQVGLIFDREADLDGIPPPPQMLL